MDGCGSVRVITPDGLINTIAGGTGGYGFAGDNGWPRRRLFRVCMGHPGPDGSLYIADQGSYRIRRVAPTLTGVSVSDIIIPQRTGRGVPLQQPGKHSERTMPSRAL